MSVDFSSIRSRQPITQADPSATATRTPEGGFAKAMSDALTDTLTAVRSAEETSAAALQGKASIQDVVETVMQAERQLQTILAIRDKVVAAYQELNRTTM
jgi:flagellar hook-basal body complex protein FliE